MKQITYILIAYLVAFSHFIIMILFLLSPFLLITGYLIKNKILLAIYILSIIFSVLSFLISRGCFLTFWEQRLRKLFSPIKFYRGGFTLYYLRKLGIKIEQEHVNLIVIILLMLSFISGIIFAYI